MSEKKICPECGKEMVFAGRYKCNTQKCLGNTDYIEVSDLAGRKETVKRSSLKPSVWAQGNEVSTHI